MFCNQCGFQLAEEAIFCSQCGKKLKPDVDQQDAKETRTIHALEMRVPYGSQTQESLLALGDGPYVYPTDSDEARTANRPFDPQKVPAEGDLVPLDCVWAWATHPPVMAGDPRNHSAIDKKFVAMGQLAGRTFNEICSYVGAPMTDINHGEYRNCVWGKTGLFGIWQIGLTFDKYGVCAGIFSETNL